MNMIPPSMTFRSYIKLLVKVGNVEQSKTRLKSANSIYKYQIFYIKALILLLI